MEPSSVRSQSRRWLMSPHKASQERIFRDRRSGRRYSIALQLEWKVFSRKRLVDQGAGTTVDISSSGILFETDHQPPAAGFMDLTITWPAKPNDVPQMRLTVVGRVVRVSGARVAVRIRRHGFATAAT